MRNNIVKEKSFDFSLEIIKVSDELIAKRQFVLSDQLLRSGTAVGAMVRESEHAESKKDFIHKLSIGLKEAGEAEYWIELIYRSGRIDQETYHNIRNLAGELNKLLIAIIRTSRENL